MAIVNQQSIDETPLPARIKADFEHVGVGIMPKNIDECLTVAKALASSGMFTDIKSAQQALAKILMGAEFGMTPIVALQTIHFIQGKMQLSGLAIATLIKKHPKYKLKVIETTNEVGKLEFYENTELLGTEVFTIKDAQRQGTQNTQKFPKNMLWNRAISNGAKFYCSDVFGGVPVYTEGEILEPEPRDEPTNTAKADSIINRIKARTEAPREDHPVQEAQFEEVGIEAHLAEIGLATDELRDALAVCQSKEIDPETLRQFDNKKALFEYLEQGVLLS